MSLHNTIRAYAIHDTDGGRRDIPYLLLRHIYPTVEVAISARQYHGLDPLFYPIFQVEISLLNGERDEA